MRKNWRGKKPRRGGGCSEELSITAHGFEQLNIVYGLPDRKSSEPRWVGVSLLFPAWARPQRLVPRFARTLSVLALRAARWRVSASRVFARRLLNSDPLGCSP